MSKILFAIGLVSVAVSIYYFWDAYQIKEQQLQRAGGDPFVLVFTDQLQTEESGTGDNEMTRLNNQRLRSEKRGWLLIISGVGLLVAATALKSWRRKPVALGIMKGDSNV
jgi:hypothetical protein